jgi:integrase
MPRQPAKVLEPADVRRVLKFIQSSRHPIRNRTIVLLSFKSGLRAKAIAERTGPRKAKVALARKLAVTLHAMWRTNTPFREAKTA